MFAWYRDAVVCYAYLSDVPNRPKTGLSASDLLRYLEKADGSLEGGLFKNFWLLVVSSSTPGTGKG